MRITGESHVRRDQHVTRMPSSTGGIAHVALGFGAGTTMEKYDLVVSVRGSQLLVDDIYCTGTDPTADDVYAAGWSLGPYAPRTDVSVHSIAGRPSGRGDSNSRPHGPEPCTLTWLSYFPAPARMIPPASAGPETALHGPASNRILK